MEVPRGRAQSGDFLLAKAVARRRRTKPKKTAGSMGDRPTDVHLSADILDQWGGLGGLGSRPDYFAGAKYIDPTETIGDGPAIDVFFFRIVEE